MMAINAEYKPPPDYKPPMIKVNDKVMIPQEEHPEINFVGLLIGPRGNTLKCKPKFCVKKFRQNDTSSALCSWNVNKV